ncbi:uncharacterized protein [Nerophis lumbriciformis]|uniref:uncharacterized protein n=1 Tax=Nerophis lumbriciformis TaxID=546530 RepID=UPI003BA86C54
MTPEGAIISGGFTSFLIQMKTRIENINREGTTKPLRTKRWFGQMRRPSDYYGCPHFQPELPPEETSDTVEQKRQQLCEIYKREGVHGGERAEVVNLMKATFCLQRNQINTTPVPSLDDLRNQWPFLFTQRGILDHLELLTDISFLRALELSIEECGQRVEMYLRTKAKNQSTLPVDEDGELTLRIIQLLMAYFDERRDALILLADMSATAADVERTLTLPTSPRLILLVAGDKVTIQRWMISMEGDVICEGVQPSFISGLAALLATYYVFNLEYQEEGARTLEFVQRRFIGVNPERGTKASQGKVVSKKTGKLVQQL